MSKNRIIADPNQVIEKNPDIILISWCGKMFKKDRMLSRPNWASIPAVQSDDLYEIKSEIILQPGPAALLDGLPLVHEIKKIGAHGVKRTQYLVYRTADQIKQYIHDFIADIQEAFSR